MFEVLRAWLWSAYRNVKATVFATMALRLDSTYQRTGSMAVLSMKIWCWRGAVQAAPDDSLDRADYLNNLGRNLGMRYQMTGVVEDLEQAIHYGREAVKVASPDNINHPEYLRNLAVGLCFRYDRTANLEDLDSGIQIFRDAVATAPGDPRHLNGLNESLRAKFERTGDRVWLDEAIRLLQTALEGISPTNSDRPECLLGLGRSLEVRYNVSGELEDIEAAICHVQEALSRIGPADQNKQAVCLSLIGAYLGKKFRRTGNKKDLDDAIRGGQEAVNAVPEEQQGRVVCLVNLGSLLRARYGLTGELEDIERAISMGREAVTSMPKYDNERPVVLSNLCTWLLIRYQTQGNPEDLEEAVRSGQESSQAATPCQLPSCLSNLVIALCAKYEKTGQIEDLDGAISAGREAVKNYPPESPERGASLINLGLSLSHRYHCLGELENIIEAIEHEQEALQITERESELWNICCGNLGSSLNTKYVATGSLDDLEQSIRFLEEALNIVQDAHPNKWRLLNNLGLSLRTKYERTGSLAVLELAIENLRRAFAKTHDHVHSHQVLNNLGWSLISRYRTRNGQEDLDEAVSCFERCAQNCAQDDAMKPRYLSNLLSALIDSFGQTQDLESLEGAIARMQEAMTSVPKDDARRGEFLYNLGSALEHKYSKSTELIVLQEARDCFETSALSESLGAMPRIRSAEKAALLSIRLSEWARASTFLETAILLLHRIGFRLISRDDQQYILRQLPTLSSLAAAAALEANKSPGEALAILDGGRGIMAGVLIGFRSDVSNFAKEHNDLHQRYVQLRDAVSLFSSNPDIGRGGDKVSNALASSRHYENFQEMQRIEQKILELPDFGQFQLPLSTDMLISLSDRGPIVAFNVTTYRSDAFIVTPSGIRSVSLPDLKHNDLQIKIESMYKLTHGRPSTRFCRNKDIRNILKWLWDVAVAPTLAELEMLSPDPAKAKPRIWWMTSGLMGLAPLHAAGHQWGVSQENTLACVISTYIPTFLALKYAREKNLKSIIDPQQKVLIVSMPQTTREMDLEVDEEVAAIQKALGGVKPVSLTTPFKQDVIDELKSSTIFHFTGHGKSDAEDPSNGGIFLKEQQGQTSDRLTARELAVLDLKDAQIAFLSACSTAENSSPNLMDEVIHVASLFQLIGFPHVIGTMWKTSNRAGIQVASEFYDILVKGNYGSGDDPKEINHDSIARALHMAVIAACSGGPRRNPSEDVLYWVPFIHIGA